MWVSFNFSKEFIDEMMKSAWPIDFSSISIICLIYSAWFLFYLFIIFKYASRLL